MKNKATYWLKPAGLTSFLVLSLLPILTGAQSPVSIDRQLPDGKTFRFLYYFELIGIPVVAVVIAIILLIIVIKWRQASKAGISTGGFSTDKLAWVFILVLLEAAALGYIAYLATVGWQVAYWGHQYSIGNWGWHIIMPAVAIIFLVLAIFLALHWRRRGKVVVMAGQTFDWHMWVVMIMLAASIFLLTYALAMVNPLEWLREVQLMNRS